MTITASESEATASEVTLGIDTHQDAHVAVALDGLDRPQALYSLGDLPLASADGYDILAISTGISSCPLLG